MTTFYAVSHLAEMSPLEVHRLYKLRVDVFVNEQQTPYVEIDDVDALDSTFHMLAWSNDSGNRELVGTARLFPAEWEGTPVMQLGRVCVVPSRRNTGLAPELIRQTLRLSFEQEPGRDVVLTAQEPLIGYYREFGFEPTGELVDDEGIPHQPMRLAAAKLAELITRK
ncbi:GNAT family N-acetyltransferase [Corynebacterium halotolerans]|uniref:N-acetyltransferase domain-containing protein n=1 Tax=Corynebacterium halotolerans YIM 70093 = DSM 44683 TaxID=1121362 RepID=M1NQ61_9CORY|nr:GNAT family N-acetyltransferase [Corynebacterium halotolerans]AGF73503.1 hypothetical protein A605_12535 [Corynebacterium halotolerans YIM 70093 = DSM 44683]